MKRSHFAAVVALVTAVATPALAQVDKTPDLGATVPGSWTTDRYAPCAVGVADGVHGRDNVAQLSVCESDSQANRLSPYNSSFFNYQGIRTAIDPLGAIAPVSQIFQLDLWVDESWATSSNGVVATSMWSRLNMFDSNNEATAWYPILAFSNSSGAGMFRYWDSNLGWQNLAATVNYGAWNSLAMEFTGNVFTAFVNGEAQYTEVANVGAVRLTDVYLEDYNSGAAFTSSWSNHDVTATPEPASLVLMATGFVGVGAVGMKRRRKAATKA